MRDIVEATKRLSGSSDTDLATIVQRDPDMIRDVAGALVKYLLVPEREHDEDCELRGGGPCYCGHQPEDEHCEACNDSGTIAVSITSFQYRAPGPVPDTARGVCENFCCCPKGIALRLQERRAGKQTLTR